MWSVGYRCRYVIGPRDWGICEKENEEKDKWTTSKIEKMYEITAYKAALNSQHEK